jgi:hypothetical protein
MKIEEARNLKKIKEIAERAKGDPKYFKELFLSINNINERIAYNASWAAGHLLQKSNNYKVDEFLPLLIEAFSNTQKGGIRRNIFKIIQHIKIPAHYHYDCADLAINVLLSNKEDIAVRAFALSILEKLIPEIPEIIDEVLFIIEKEKSFASPAFVVRSVSFEKAAEKFLKNNG